MLYYVIFTFNQQNNIRNWFTILGNPQKWCVSFMLLLLVLKLLQCITPDGGHIGCVQCQKHDSWLSVPWSPVYIMWALHIMITLQPMWMILVCLYIFIYIRATHKRQNCIFMYIYAHLHARSCRMSLLQENFHPHILSGRHFLQFVCMPICIYIRIDNLLDVFPLQ